MKQYLIVTNNPLVNQKLKNENIYFCEDLEQVMNKARDLIHLGHKLITHPLSGSVKPVQSPYKSIILTATKKNLDYKSLEIIEAAIFKVKQFKENHLEREYPDQVLVDYQIVDLSLIESGLKGFK